MDVLGTLEELNAVAIRNQYALNRENPPKDGFQQAHGIGSSLASKMLSYRATAGFSTADTKDFDQPWNVTHVADSEAGAYAIGGGFHRGPQVDAYDSLTYDYGGSSASSNKFLNVLENETKLKIDTLKVELADPDTTPERKLVIEADIDSAKADMRVKTAAFSDLLKILNMDQAILDKYKGEFGPLHQLAYNKNSTIRGIDDANSLTNYLNRSEIQEFFSFDNLNDNKLFNDLVNIRNSGSGDPLRDIGREIVDLMPDASRVFYPTEILPDGTKVTHILWDDEVRADIFARQMFAHGRADSKNAFLDAIEKPEFAELRSQIHQDLVDNFNGEAAKPNDFQEYLRRATFKDLEAKNFDVAKDRYLGIYQKAASIDIDLLDKVNAKDGTNYWTNLDAVLDDIEADTSLSTKHKVIGAIGAFELAFGAFSVYTKYKAETVDAVDPITFDDWLAQQVPGALAYTGVGAAAGVGMYLLSFAGPVGVAITLTAVGVGTYAMIRETLNDYVIAYGHIEDDPIVPIASAILGALEEFESSQVVQIVTEAAKLFADQVLSPILSEIVPDVKAVSGYKVAFSGAEDSWLIGDQAASLVGNASDNKIFHFGAGQAHGGDGNDWLVSYKADYIREGEYVDPNDQAQAELNGILPEEERVPVGGIKAFQDHALLFEGDAGDDTLIVWNPNYSAYDIEGGAQPIRMNGGDGNDWLFARTGDANFYIKGDAGDDFIYVDNPSKSASGLTIGQERSQVYVEGGAGNDWYVGFGAAEINLGAGSDTVWTAGTGSVIHTGPGGADDADHIRFARGSLITDADAHDTVYAYGFLSTAGTYFTFGGSEAQYAYGKFGLVKVGFNSDGEMVIGDIFSEEDKAETFTYLANGNGNPLALSSELTAGIRVGAGELHVGHLLDGIPEGISLAERQAFWEFLRIVLKEFFGEEYTGGADPLVLDLDGDGLELTAMATGVSPMFDIDGDGFLEYTGWVSPDDGMLALDSNANGKIDDVGELFGGPGASGFAELATHDDNEDGVINAEDAIFGDLRVWRDLDRDGETDEGELFGLEELGIASIDTAGVEDGTRNSLNIVMRSGSFTRDDGTTGQVGDIEFQLNNFDTVFAGDTTVSQDVKDTMPNLKGHGTLSDLHVSIMHDGLDGNLATTIRSVLPTMTEVDFGDLSAKALTILEAWTAAPPGEPIVGNNPDVPVLLKRDSGNLSVLDFAVEVTEDVTVTDEEGVETVVEKTFWKLASGRTVTNGEGQEIEFPTFDDVMAQIAETEGAAWEIVTGAEIDYLERYIGEEIPVEDPDILDANGISALNNLLETTRRVMDQQALRLAMQGGLEEYFDGVEYSVEEDKFVATSAAELIPFFEKVFEAAPADADGAQGWLDAWKPLIDALLSDYDRPGISQLSKPFLFTNIVTAFENVGLSISLADAAETLGIPKELVDYGSGSRVGSSEGNIYYMSSGDDVVESKDGPDVFVFGRDFGHDVIDDFKEFGDDFDVIRFAHLTPADITAVRDGRDLILTVNATGDSVRIIEQFYEKAFALGGGQVLPTRGVNEIVFADGSVWTPSDIAVAVSHPTDADETIIGTDHLDYLDGGAGNDYLSGAEGNDIYVFDVGYGHDTIEDNNEYILSNMQDILQFGENVRFDDISVVRDGFSNDVKLVLTSGDTLTIKGQFAAHYPGIFDKIHFDQIEYFNFANSEDGDKSFTADDLMNRILEEASTDGDDVIYGFDRDDRLDGGKGNDILVGGNDSDTYIYNLGYGHDIFKEEVTPEELRVLSGQDDKVLFGAGIYTENIRLERNGKSNDLVFHFSDGGTLTVEAQFFANNLGSRLYEIKQFIFSDGTEWSVKDLELQLLASDEADNTLYGFHGSDVLDGGAGNDYLNGLDGDDTYHFGYGYGQDVIYDETVSVFSGDADKLLFGDGITASDVTWSRPDNGNDLVATLSDGSSVRIQSQFFANNLGTRLHDIEIFEFSDGSTTSIEEIQKALLTGDDGDDTLIGFHSHDVLDGGAGNDYLNGKDGDDTYHFGYGYGQDVIYDETVSVFSGDADKLLFGEGITASDVTWSRPDNGNDLVARLSDGSSVRIQSQFFTNSLGGRLHDIEIFEFSDGSTISVANIQSLLLRGTSGDDTLVGFAYGDELRGGEGNDVLNGGRGNDNYVYARGDGNDVIREDIYEGYTDVLTLTDILPTEVKLLRDGNHLIVKILETSQGAGDGGSILAMNTISGRYYGGIEELRFADGTVWSHGDIVARATEEGLGITHWGTNEEDTIIGTNGNDVFKGLEGADHLSGGARADTYVYSLGDGNDTILDDSGSSTYTDRLVLTDLTSDDVELTRTNSHLIIKVLTDGALITVTDQFKSTFAKYGIEEIVFSDGTVWNRSEIQNNAWIRGTDGDDQFVGTTGEDTFYGDLGNDTFNGGNGNDTYIYSRGDGNDTITEGTTSGNYDKLVFTDINASDVSLSRDGNDLTVTIAESSLGTGDGGSVLLKSSIGGSVAAGVESIVFADGTIWTESNFVQNLSDEPAGEGPSDVTVHGTDSHDTLNGTTGSDVFLGGGGDDVLNGKRGSDTYYYGLGDGSDFVDDQHSSTTDVDRFEFQDLNASDVELSHSGNDLIIEVLSDGSRITFDDQFYSSTAYYGIEQLAFADGTVWDRATIDAKAWYRGTSGNDTITGTTGSDVYLGGAGDDVLNGKRGSDTYYYGLGDGSDFVDDQHSSTTDVDRFEFQDLNASDVELSHSGNDLIIEVLSDGSRITFDDQFYSSTAYYGIEQLAFADGTVWDRATIQSYADENIL